MIIGEGIAFAPAPPELKFFDLHPGDVLIWFSRKKSRIGAAIREFSGGPYSHVGIYIGDGLSVDAGPHGVHQVPLVVLQNEFAYGRVFRYPSLDAVGIQKVVDAAIDAAAREKGYAWMDAITLPLRRAAYFARHRHFMRRPLLALPGALFLAKRRTPDPVKAPTTFCSRMILEAYYAANVFHKQDLQQCVWTPNDIAVIGIFEYVGWLNHIAPPTPEWHPMDPYSPEPVKRFRRKWWWNPFNLIKG